MSKGQFQRKHIVKTAGKKMTVMYLLRIQNTSFEHEKLRITEVMCKIWLLIKGCSR